MAGNLQRFLGGSPGAVLVKLIFLSLLVGAFLAFLDLSPFEVVDWLVRGLRSMFGLSFDTIRDVVRWIAYGAVIVVPLWLLLRIIRAGR
jgi:hypothetical protein